MGCYNQSYDYALEQYLRRATKTERTTMRHLDRNDFEIIQEYRKISKQINELITEIVAILTLMEMTETDSQQYYVKTNLHSIIRSLQKQRDKGYVIKRYFAIVPPIDEREKKGISNFVRGTKSRVDFVRKTAVASNIVYTPILEYMEIVGIQDFTQELHRQFGDTPDLVEANKGSEEMKQYAQTILQKVQDAGKMDAYRERLAKYNKLSEEKSRREKEEKEEAKRKEHMEIAQAEILNFQRIFNNAVSHVQGDDRINMSQSALERKLLRDGRNASYVLCCYVKNKRIVYRYVGKEKKMYPSFGSAFAFSAEEADEVAHELGMENPEMLFESIQLSS